MKNQIFKDNVEDNEIRFKQPEELFLVVNRNSADKCGGNNGR